jgi:hypothetical protein
MLIQVTLANVPNYSLGKEKTKSGRVIRVTNSLSFSYSEAFLTILRAKITFNRMNKQVNYDS